MDDRAARLRHDRRLQIVEAAKQVFAEMGYHNASISEIIARAGIARGTFYLYFPNKRNAFDAILTDALGELTRRVRVISLAPEAPPPRRQLHTSLVDVLTYVLEDRPLTQLLLNHGLTPDAEASERVEAFFSHVRSMIESSLHHGIQMGLIRPCPCPLVAAALFGSIRGSVRYMLQLEHPDVPELADELISFALEGVVKPDRWSGGYSTSAHGGPVTKQVR